MLSWLDQLLFGVRKVFNGGTELPDRPAIKFTGAGVVASDDATNNLTLVTIAGGGGGGGALDVVTYDASVSATAAITRTGARMFIHAIGNFTALVLPFPTVGDEITIKVTGLAGGTSILVADPTRLLDGQTSYKFTADNQGLELVYVGGGHGWKIASEIGIPGVLELSGAGPFHNLDLTGYRAVRFTNASSVNLTGCVPPPAGVHRRWSATSTNGLTISHQSSSSDAGKRFDFFANSTKSVAGRNGVEFYYDHATSYFRIDGYPDG